MPGPISTALKTAAVLIGCLAAADVAGVVVCTLFDVMPLRATSAVLPYAIWLVLGIFCGLIAYHGAGTWALHREDERGEWTGHPDAFRTGNIIVCTSAAIILALILLFHRLYWSQGVAGEYYVPDSASHTLVYFLSALGAITAAHFLLLPEKSR